MKTPTGTFTVAEAAEAWIAMIESPETKATPEQKAALIAQIREAAPKTKEFNGTGYDHDNFVMRVNDIRKTIRG